MTTEMGFVPKLALWWRNAKSFLKKLSPRELGLIGAAAAVVLFIVGYTLTDNISALFHTQYEQLTKARGEARALASSLGENQKLRARRDEIEAHFRAAEIKEGMLPFLENMLQKHLNIPASKASMKDLQSREFGGMYEQASFSVHFSTKELDKLVAFLRELAFGSRPLILGRLDLVKNRQGDALDVDLEVSTIRRKDSVDGSEAANSDDNESDLRDGVVTDSPTSPHKENPTKS